VGSLALLLALAGVAALAAGAAGKLVAVGFGVLAVACGLLAFRRRGAPPGGRLVGAAGAALGLAALLLGGAKVALTLLALARLTSQS
jgi:hypothetical protein